ncbi:PDDEXK nuclease domain-containing protein [Patulibacter defluvii]|uniref:PDDEXK nuclease domain-containing protein n=1 Tax=Patulibacter defluvii TaxID=3095358 RepID=UPI002A75655A|nr:PDDEXK nuclease domain-containing protein [Patulibacter sp. DM4]
MTGSPARRTAAEVATSPAYRALLATLSERIRSSRNRAARAVNTELVLLYWSIGREILDRQEQLGWGDDVVGRLSEDLRTDTGGVRGFSRRNLFYMRRFAALWPEAEKVQTLSAQLGWSHHQVLLDAFSDEPEPYAWYVTKAREQGWSVRHLKAQIDLRLHERTGTAISNFPAALPADAADRTLAATKDPYVFDFLDLTETAQERELEQALIDDIQRFLLELGTGFAFYGRQKALQVGEREFFLDLLFYHQVLRRFVVIDLKIGPFQPEHVSKMNLYLNAVDEQLRHGDDQESVGIILCTSRDETVAKLALHRVYAPIAVSTWRADVPPELPAVEVGDEVPRDLASLAELEDVRARLLERVSRRTSER